jgi:hypothetical protein
MQGVSNIVGFNSRFPQNTLGEANILSFAADSGSATNSTAKRSSY